MMSNSKTEKQEEQIQQLTSSPPSEIQMENLDLAVNLLIKNLRKSGKTERQIKRYMMKKFRIRIIDEDKRNAMQKKTKK